MGHKRIQDLDRPRFGYLTYAIYFKPGWLSEKAEEKKTKKYSDMFHIEGSRDNPCGVIKSPQETVKMRQRIVV